MTPFSLRCRSLMWLLMFCEPLNLVRTFAQDVDTSHRLKLPEAQQAELRKSDDLNGQLLELYRKGEYAAAMKLAEQGLEIRERILGPEHIETGTFVNNLAAMHSEAGNYAAAEKLYLRAVRIDERYAGPDHPKTALRISNLALVYLKQARFEEARQLLQRALAINEEKLGPEHPDTAVVLNNLAGAFKDEQKYAQAVPLFERALQIREKALGPDHEDTASTLGNLAGVYVFQGNYAKAEPLHLRAVSITEKTLGADHPVTAIKLGNLAQLYEAQGDLVKAQELNVRVLKTMEKKLGPEHPVTATALANLAKLYKAQGDLAELEKVHKRVLAIREKQLGPEHPDTSLSLNDLAIVFTRTKRFAESETLLKRAVGINEKALGALHPQTATALGNLASVYMDQGKYADAIPLSERSVRIKTKAMPNSHPDVAYSLVRLACLQEAIGKTSEAAATFDRARRSTAEHTSGVLPALSEQQQALFIETNFVNHFSRALSLTFRHPDTDSLVQTSAAWVVNGKGIRQEALAERNLLTRDINNPDLAETINELQSVRKNLASLAMMTVPPDQIEKRDEVLKNLTAAEQQLSGKLTSQSSDTGAKRREWIEHQQIRDAIPEGTVFVDIVSLQPFVFEATLDEINWQPTRYVAWVTHAADGAATSFVDLGDAGTIDPLVNKVRTSIQAAGGSSGTVAADGNEAATEQLMKDLRRLADRVWKPLESHVGTASHIVLSPDGTLWLTPWNCLPVGKEQDQFLLEKFAVSYVISGRDLVRQPVESETTEPVILANPLFDLNAEDKRNSIQEVFEEIPATDETTMRGFAAKELLPSASALPNTAIEALAIQPSLEKLSGQAVNLYEEQYALERIAKALYSPRVAAFATHGFFLPTQKSSLEDQEALTGSDTRSAAFDTSGKPIENPLLRCGLLFAGCNDRNAAVADDDGILTGMEIVSIDFRGTELVVLSACETGIGDVKNGEGVAGLRQAFQLAGAEAVVSTLWQVPDRDSALLMSKFFEELAAGKPKSEALRAAQLERIEKRRERYGAAHPFFWAAFTLTGQ